MAVIDPKKLLPSSNKSENSEKFLVPMSSIVLKKNVAISSRLLKPEAPKDEGKGGAIVPNKLISKVVKIETILKSNLVSQISQQNKKEREQKQKEVEEREKKLEIKPESKGKVPLPSLPRIGFLDALRNYFINTLLGFIAVKLFDMAPKLIKFLDAIKPVAGFIGEFAGNLFNGLVEFVDKGYKAYDQVQKFVKSVGGENAEKLFNDFSKNLNLVLNGAIIASMIAISTAPKRPGGFSGGTGGGVAGGVKAGANILERGSLSRVNESFGRYISGKANIGDRARLLRRGFIGGRQALTKGGTEALEKGAARTAARTAASQTAKQVATQGAKQSLKSLVAVPIIGSLIGFIIDTVVFREPPSRAAAGAVGSALGQGIGIALAGGTTFGLGAGIGMFVGGFVGDWIGKALYDTITGYKPEPIQGKAQGGAVSSGKTPPRRAIKVQRAKPRRIVTQKTQPGKDIGGVKKIEELYGEDKPGTRSALRALKKSSEDVKRMRSLNGLSGAMFGAGIDMALGQKPDKNLSASLGSMFGAVIQTAIDSELNNTFGDITKTIAMAGGGVVPSRELKSNMSIGERIGRYISSALAVSIESSASKILQNLNKELRLEGGSTTETPYDKPLPNGDLLDYEVTGGELPSGYPGRGNRGIPGDHKYPARDYQIEVGKAISVFKPGTVVYAGLNPSGYGNLVIIRHEDGKQSAYAHLSKINVREGDKISEGEKKVIGLTGGAAGAPGAGNSTGPHLHFEVRDSKGNQITSYNDGDAYFRFGTVTGVRKRTPLEMSRLSVEPTGQQLQGEISWYGPGFYGKRTASGEIFTGNEMTAAHKTLPFGTLVRVTWKGKSIVVRINDRGPFHADRVLDLSRAAAEELGMPGVANGAKIEIVKQKPSTTSPPPTLGKVLSSTKVGGETYTVREGGKYYKNGKEINQSEYDKAFGLELSSIQNSSATSQEVASLGNFSTDKTGISNISQSVSNFSEASGGPSSFTLAIQPIHHIYG